VKKQVWWMMVRSIYGVKRTCFHSSQPLVLPSLKELQRFFDAFLQRQPVPVETPDTNTIRLVRIVGFESRTDIRRLGILVGLQRFANEANKVSGLLEQIFGLSGIRILRVRSLFA